jgi:hypothetical protein
MRNYANTSCEAIWCFMSTPAGWCGCWPSGTSASFRLISTPSGHRTVDAALRCRSAQAQTRRIQTVAGQSIDCPERAASRDSIGKP